jgi:hypothetical protein
VHECDFATATRMCHAGIPGLPANPENKTQEQLHFEEHCMIALLVQASGSFSALLALILACCLALAPPVPIHVACMYSLERARM